VIIYVYEKSVEAAQEHVVIPPHSAYYTYCIVCYVGGGVGALGLPAFLLFTMVVYASAPITTNRIMPTRRSVKPEEPTLTCWDGALYAVADGEA
jgi:hypothetical protein